MLPGKDEDRRESTVVVSESESRHPDEGNEEVLNIQNQPIWSRQRYHETPFVALVSR